MQCKLKVELSTPFLLKDDTLLCGHVLHRPRCPLYRLSPPLVVEVGELDSF